MHYAPLPSRQWLGGRAVTVLPEQQQQQKLPQSQILAQVQALAANEVQAKKLGSHFKVSLYLAVLFFFLASPVSFKITGEIIKYFVTNVEFLDESGKPTTVGLIVHSVVFFGVLFFFTSS